MPFLSYAGNHEDVLLHRLFGDTPAGFYIDIGAGDPVTASVTKAFYERGWSGINVEASTAFDRLVAARPRDVNLRLVVTDGTGAPDLPAGPTDGTAPRAAGSDRPARLRCDTLEAIFAKHGGLRRPDFVRIGGRSDAAAIIASTDWRKLRPRLLLVQIARSGGPVTAAIAWDRQLAEQAYVRACFDGLNLFYAPAEDAPAFARHLDRPVNVLDDFVSYAEHSLRLALRALSPNAPELAAPGVDLSGPDVPAPGTAGADGSRAQAAPAQAAAPVPTARRSFRRRVLRAVALAAYRPFRPFLRPLFWRLRGFVLAGVSEQLRDMRERLSVLETEQRVGFAGLRATAASLRELDATMRCMATEVESAVLTVMLERAAPQDAPAEAADMPFERGNAAPPRAERAAAE